MYPIGRVMRDLMSRRGATQADICRATGVKKQNLSVICKGQTQWPTIKNCKLICDYFGITLDELWALIDAASD